MANQSSDCWVLDLSKPGTETTTSQASGDTQAPDNTQAPDEGEKIAAAAAASPQVLDLSKPTAPPQEQQSQKAAETSEPMESQQPIQSQVSNPVVKPGQNRNASKLFQKIQELQEKQKQAEMAEQNRLVVNKPSEQSTNEEQKLTPTNTEQPVEKNDTDTNSVNVSSESSNRNNVINETDSAEAKKEDNESESQADDVAMKQDNESESQADDVAMKQDNESESQADDVAMKQDNESESQADDEARKQENESKIQADDNLLKESIETQKSVESETKTDGDKAMKETETETKDNSTAKTESESLPKSISESSFESQNESESHEKPFASYERTKGSEDSQPNKHVDLESAPVPRVTLEDIAHLKKTSKSVDLSSKSTDLSSKSVDSLDDLAHLKMSRSVDSPQNPVIEIDILHNSRPSSAMSVSSSENPTIEVNFEDVNGKGSANSSVMKDEDSNMSQASNADNKESEEPSKVKTKKPASRKRGPDLSLAQLTGRHQDSGLTAEHLFEYRWPQEGKGDWFMIQEQVSEFLGVKSFKRKYPDLPRRNIDPQERLYLREKGVVTEMQADLGLTIVKADLIHDLLSKDYIHKYKEYVSVLRERKKQQAIQRNKELQAQKSDVNTLANLREKAMKSAVSFNAMLNRERKEERKAYFDVHTFEVQFPYDKRKILPPERTKVGAYPVALIPGQFQNYYKRYTTQELNYLPLNTAVYSSPKKQPDMYADPLPGSDGESDDEVSSESSEAPSLVNSEGESMEIASDMFEDSDNDGNENDKDEKDGEGDEEGQTDPGKTKEEKKEEINRKVQEILEKLHYKESRKGKRGRPPLTEEMKRARLEQRIKAKEQAKAEALANAHGIKIQFSEGENSSSAAQSPGPGSGTATPIKTKTPRRVKKSKDLPVCNICSGTEEFNASKQAEAMVQCAECSRYGHPSCLELTTEMITIIKTYPWQCMECKTCVKCKDAQHEDCMLFCDHCDRGYHTFCVGLQTIPNGRWECPSCLPQGVMLDPLTDTEVVRTPSLNTLSPVPNTGAPNQAVPTVVPQPPVSMLASSTPNRPVVPTPMMNILATASVIPSAGPLANMSNVPPPQPPQPMIVPNQPAPMPTMEPVNPLMQPPQPNYGVPVAQPVEQNPEESMDMS